MKIRCIAPRHLNRPNGARCGGFVTRAPAGAAYEVLGLVAHSDLAAPDSEVFACSRCRVLHEVSRNAVASAAARASTAPCGP